MELDYKLLNGIDKEYGESFYLLDSKQFSDNFDEFIGAFRSIYPKVNVGYSYKTNYTPKLCKIIDEKGAYAEVVSEMEYDLACKIKVEHKNIIVNGPYKNKKALSKFLLNGSVLNLDNYSEFDILKEIISENPNTPMNIGLRCNFEINDKTVSRFGFDVYEDTFKNMIEELKNIPSVHIKGLHCHFPNRDLESYGYRVDTILKLSDELFGSSLEYIDIGGGYFGKMEDSLKEQFSVKVPQYKEYARLIATKFNEHFSYLEDSKKPTLLLEPGSALVADTMKFVAKVMDIKNIRGNAIAITSGSKFNIGLLTSSINMPMKVYSGEENRDFYEKIDVSGFTCIESDYLFKSYSGEMNKGDYLVFSNVGSYSIVFKPPFILPNVPVVEIDCDTNDIELIKRQETVEDVFKTFIF